MTGPRPQAPRQSLPSRLLARLIALPVRAYRLVLSPWVGHGCRFQPTCSAYALEALERHGGVKGGYMMVHRLCRCHPWGGHGYDPVPGADPDHDQGGARPADQPFDSAGDGRDTAAFTAAARPPGADDR